MRIADLTVHTVHVNHRGDWLFVQIHADDGRVGIGEASHGGGVGGDTRVRTILEQQCRPRLVDRTPDAVVMLVTELEGIAVDRAGATAVSACEQALWDLAGQALDVPVYRLLGGPARARLPLYANINRATVNRTPEGFAANAAAAVAEGFRAVKCAPFDGLLRDRLYTTEGQSRLRLGLACVAAVRAAIGPDVALLVDYHSRFDGKTAGDVAQELRALGVTWLEEPIPTEDLDGLRQFRRRLNTHGLANMDLIGGEAIFGLSGFWPYLQAGVWDVVMPDVKHCGGILAGWLIGQTATAGGVAVAPHNPSGPVATAATAQFCAALPQLRILEYAWGEVPWRADLVEPPERIENGELIVPEGPGIGVRLRPEVLANMS